MLQEFLKIEELKSTHEEKIRLMEREMALSTPILTNLEHIPMLYRWYCELTGCSEGSGGLNANQKGQFLLIILFFYSPITLVGGKTVNGVRDRLAKLFGFNSPSAVSNLRDVISFYETYKGYRKTIDQLSDEILSRLKENGIIPQNPIL